MNHETDHTMKLTTEQKALMKDARKRGQRRVHLTLTSVQRRAYRAAAKQEDANLRRVSDAERRKTAPSKSPVTVSEALKAAIDSSGLTHYRLAKNAGLSPDAIDRFVAGHRSLTLGSVNKLAAALGLTLTRLTPSKRKSET
jgi:antitoxin component HigA of HigAB toxin-antitoxin module